MFLKRILMFGWAVAAFGQSNNVTGAGYSLPGPITVAPGQILNLTVAGVGASLTGRVAAPSFPLPLQLAGISVQLLQTADPHTVAAPILAVRPVSTCPSGTAMAISPCGRYTVVTIQVPYEMVVLCPTTLCPTAITNPPQLVVSENGVAGGAIALSPLADQVHVANACDLDTAATYPCTPAPMVTHADGSLVTADSPAQVGEEVVIYALGLGATNPAAQTGQAAPSPAPATTSIAGVEYNFAINAPATPPIFAPFAACAIGVTCPVAPVFSGLTSGLAGLYQVNVVIPASQSIYRCGLGVVSNLTITIVGAVSRDGAGICVAAQ